MKIYVSGKITGIPRDEAAAIFEQARERLLLQGHEPFVPTVLPDYADVSHGDYLHVCHAMIDICDAVYVLDNWRTSTGSHEEIQYAADWRKEIIYEDEATRQDGFPTDRRKWNDGK